MKRLRKGDQVRIMRGAEKGKEGKIKRIFPEEERATVEGAYKFKRYKKGYGIVESERPIHLSNLALISPNKKEGLMKVSYCMKGDKKERVKRIKASK